MDVAAYIKELLYQEHFVYVPGLGTFLTRKTASVYNQGQQLFYPPKNWIDFVEEEKKDDALENYMSGQKNISATAARYFIDKFVDQLKADALNRNLPVKEVLFPETGEAVSASLKEHTVFNRENFGLPPVNLPPVIKEEPIFTEKEAVTKQDYVENFYREFSKNLPEEEESNPQKSIGFWSAVFLLLTACILGCYALYLYYPDIYSRLINHNQPKEITVVQKPVLDTIQQKQTIKEDSSLTKNTTDTSANVTKTVTAKPSVTKKTVAVIKPAVKPLIKDTVSVAEAADPDLVEKSPYEIIGATFKTLKGAKTFLSQLKAKGMHHAKILKTSGKLKLITFGSFKDKEPAQAALEKLRARDPHSDAHIQHYTIK
ncbi:HU domain-containing protein [Mucilaginibacter arboris]|uniref:SPOR domain-containing protein n=1 Tax=Mucilaginibacter arboris TaxID=2682090 RepID=A0A7K1SUV8_9SPHI|nr:SPOR domain-containing protein [Mucilaginibacter arboris]MVN21116.1 hypothetical protein [Mucilaginibacter arboris]